MIKLVAFDVDGTIRDGDYLPSSARSAIGKLLNAGIIVTLCTGRSEYEMKSLRKELGIGWAVTCNGCHIGFQGKTVDGQAFPKETVQAWLKEADRAGHFTLLYGSEGMWKNRQECSSFRQAQHEIGFMEPDFIRDPSDVPDIYQYIAFCGEEEEHRYLGTDIDRYYTHRWQTRAIDINPGGMNKAVGLKRLLDHLSIGAEETAAFGDGTNDHEMLESVACGIAMGNASDELKAKARYVTKSLREDGIAYAVERWILSRV